MLDRSSSQNGKLWVYAVLPPVILNVVAIIIFGGYYALQATRPTLVAWIRPEQVQFGVYVVIFVVEWVFALLLLRQGRAKGRGLTSLIAEGGEIWGFRWPMAVLLFVVFNALFVAYVPLVSAMYGQWPRLHDLAMWQRVFLVVAVPFQAAFCEELIWRGHIITGLISRGKPKFAAILLSGISFALLHGIFLPDKLLLTFLIGIVAGVYYVRERNLLPLMISHFVADVWTFALSAFL